MKVLLEDAGLRKQLVERGYRRVKEFSWGRCAQETLQVYREVLGG
jgi:glycosyltransferase involved in cell wall biosynthesis